MEGLAHWLGGRRGRRTRGGDADHGAAGRLLAEHVGLRGLLGLLGRLLLLLLGVGRWGALGRDQGTSWGALAVAQRDLRHVDVLLRLGQTHGVPVALVHPQVRPLGSQAHTEAVRAAAPAVDDALWCSVVLLVHRVASSVLGSRGEGRRGLRHDLTAAPAWGSPRHPRLLVLGSLGEDVVLDTHLLLVGNGVDGLLGVTGHHAVRSVHVESPLAGRPGHVLGRGGTSLLVRVLEPGLLPGLLAGVAPGPSTGVGGVGVGHGEIF